MYRHHLEKLVRTRLDDILVDEGVLDHSKLQEIQSEQDQSGSLLSDILIESGGFDEFELAKLQVKSYGLPFVDVKLFNIRREVLELLPFDYCKRRGVLPVEQFGQSLAIACWEIPTPELLEELVAKTKLSIFLYVGVRPSMLEVIAEQTKKLARSTPQRAPVAKVAAPAASPTSAAATSPAPVAAAQQPSQPRPAATIATTVAAAATAAAPAAARTAVPAAVPGAVPASAPSPSVSAPGSRLAGPESVSATSSVDTPEAPLPPLSIPFISMKLNATAQEASAPRRTPGPRSSGVVAGAALGSILGPAGSQAPEPSLPATPAVVPSAVRAASGVTKPAAGAIDPQRPRTTRAAPVIPAALGAAPAKNVTEWESVFDQGESAVRESATGELPPKPRT